MNRKPAYLAPLLAALVLLALAPTASARSAPAPFTGIVPQGPHTARDLDLMESSGVTSIRLPMYWMELQTESFFVAEPDFDGFDRQVKLAAERGIRVLPFIWGTPEWVASEQVALPVANPWQRWGWKAFLDDAVERYGPDGTFWDEHTAIDRLPIRAWEIWNEQNIVTFSGSTDPAPYARLLRESGSVLHAADPGSRVILGGLFGRPLQIPPNTASGDFLSRLYRVDGVRRHFDGVALHPYVADAGAMRAQIRNLRRIMRLHGDAATPLYVTEVGWGSASAESRWERGLGGQVREMRQAMSMLLAHRGEWRIGGVWWFSWVDLYDSCQFCDSAGLLTAEREAKPSWYLFNRWTGGDAGTVPRASLGD